MIDFSIQQEIIKCGGIENYLHKQQNKPLLRLFTCGNVDDGKSTLIGRLLHDSKKIYDDELSILQIDSKKIGTKKDKLDLALLMDGLQEERSQGITIDVAYRYFSTQKRKFIIADTPGHEEYTRNMVTGASTSDIAILLIDAKKGICDQTKRHWLISILLGVKYIIVVINKMDLVDYSRKIFQKISEEYLKFTSLFFTNVKTVFIPISAVDGDNIIILSKNMSWYRGATLFSVLEEINMENFLNFSNKKLRFPIQYVIRDHLGFRGYAGTIASGSVRIGQCIQVFPSSNISIISRIIVCNVDQLYAQSGDAITITLEDDLDVSRGDILIDSDDKVINGKSALVDVIWMTKKSLMAGQLFDIKIANKILVTQVDHISYQIDISTLSRLDTNLIPVNGIGLVQLSFNEPLILDQYNQYPITGSMIFIDCVTNETVGAGMIRDPIGTVNYRDEDLKKFEYALHKLVCRYFPHWKINDL